MNIVAAPTQQVTIKELVQLGATNSDLFCRGFFPNTMRQASPIKHKEIWAALEDPGTRLLLVKAFRGSAKTSLLRMFTAKRIAYSVSRTILYIGASEDHAIRSVQWVRTQIEKNALFASTFGLSKGRKWEETELEIIHGVDRKSIWLKGVGITGNIRGINFDDYRPDLIVCDDIVTDENASTLEQREKVINLVLGAIKGSLTPSTEEPNAKMALLQTPLHQSDVVGMASADPQWKTIVFPCWTDETRDLPIEQQESSWPERFTSDELRKDKMGHAAQNRLSVFLREYECRITSPEVSAFRGPWLKRYEEVPTGVQAVLSIDPTPPPTQRMVAKKLADKDYEVIAVTGRKGPDYFLLDYAMNRGHEPNWTIAKTMELAWKWRVQRLIIETVAYQATLKWLIEQEMKRRGIYYPVTAMNDRRPKANRIKDALSGVTSQGHFFVSPRHVDFIEQFEQYPDVAHDDVLDAVAMGLSDLINPYLELEAGEYYETEKLPTLNLRRRAP